MVVKNLLRKYKFTHGHEDTGHYLPIRIRGIKPAHFFKFWEDWIGANHRIFTKSQIRDIC